MKNKISDILLGLVFMLGLTACYEDKGNYDYLPETAVKFENIEDSYVITQFDTLKISPVLTMAEGNYKYSWRIWSNELTGSVMEEIAADKELNYRVNQVPGSYTMVFAITDTDKKTNEYLTMRLDVLGEITEGWMVLHEKDGKSDFDLLLSPYFSNRVKQDIHFRSLYESVNGEPLPGGRGVKVTNYYNGNFQYVYVLAENAGVRLSAVNMKKMYDLSSLVVDGKPLKPQAYGWLPWGTMNYFAEMLISDGRLYIGPFGENQFAEPIFRNGGSYKAAPFIPTKHSWMLRGVVYDELNGRYLKVENTVFTFEEFPAATGALFDWNHMNAHMLHSELGFKDYEYSVMEDWTTGKRTMYVMDFTTEEDRFAIALYPTDGCPAFDKASCFAVGRRGNVFFYGAEDKVYLYDYSGSNSAKAVVEVPAGEQITHMKILKPNEDYYMTNHPYDNKVLIFSTFNEQTREGKVYMYYINEANGALDKASGKVYAGFGEIIDMDFNYPKY